MILYDTYSPVPKPYLFSSVWSQDIGSTSGAIPIMAVARLRDFCPSPMCFWLFSLIEIVKQISLYHSNLDNKDYFYREW